jgi:hypothetical protein
MAFRRIGLSKVASFVDIDEIAAGRMERRADP